MKAAFLEFFIRLSLIWALLLLFYQWVLANNDNWRLKRAFLLGAYLLGWIIPALPTVFSSSSMPELSLTVGGMEKIVSGQTDLDTTQQAPINWRTEDVIFFPYLVVVLWHVVRLTGQYLRLQYWIRTGRRSHFRSHGVIYHKKIVAPFAALNTIFLPEKTEPAAVGMICLHESIHLKNNHLPERIPLVLGQLFLWFHPLQWWYLRRQEAVQEYEVDEEVIREYTPSAYGRLLIQSSMMPLTWYPQLFSSPLKKRIDMMLKKKNKRPWQKWQSLVLGALLPLMIIGCSDLVEGVTPDRSPMLTTEVDQPPVLIGENRRDFLAGFCWSRFTEISDILLKLVLVE